MKYKPKQYAEALVDLLLSKKADEKKISDNFLKLLKKNGDMKKAGEIMALAENLLLKKTGNKKVILETARKTDTKDFISKFTKKGDIVKEKIKPELIAGLKITTDNKQLDFSLKNKLNKMFNVGF